MFRAVGSLLRRPPIRWEKIAPISTSIALPSRDGHYGISAKGLKDFMTRNQIDKSKKMCDVVEEIVVVAYIIVAFVSFVVAFVSVVVIEKM